MPFDIPATENAERHVTRLTKRHLVKPFWILLVPFLFPSALAAEPSLAETVQYIEAKISANKINRWSHVTFRQIGQNITYKYYDSPRMMTYTFQLGTLSTTVEIRENHDKIYEVKASCTRGLCIRVKQKQILDPAEEGDGLERENVVELGGLTFWVTTNNSAGKLRKVLVHAIKLSGGKDELF